MVGHGEIGRSTVTVLISDPPVAVYPHELEEDDSLKQAELPPKAVLRLRCGEGDVDGARLILNSTGSTLIVSAWVDGKRLEPGRVLHGLGHAADAVPLQIGAGSSLLRVPPTNPPQLPAEGPLLYLWRVDERALSTVKVEMDEELSDRLKTLGYLQ